MIKDKLHKVEKKIRLTTDFWSDIVKVEDNVSIPLKREKPRWRQR